MPFIPHTPESLLPRSDSKNPATTCKGITSNGRPCRRTLAAASNSPSLSPNAKRGVLAVLPDVDEDHEGAAAFFCWQHKDQAEVLADTGNSRRTQVLELKERSSIDTLIDRLGVLEVQKKERPSIRKQKNKDGIHQVRRATLPKQWRDVPGPLMSVPEDPFSEKPVHGRPPRPKQQRVRTGGPTFSLSLFCCIGSVDPEDVPPAPIRHQNPSAIAQKSYSPKSTLPHGIQPVSQRPQPSPGEFSKQSAHLVSRPPLISNFANPVSDRPSSSQTHALLSLIPRTLTPSTTSTLLAELAKPLPPTSAPGYIYIFWLTPATAAPPSPTLTSSLLAPPTPADSRQPNTRAPGGYFTKLGSRMDELGKESTILLKIGRASNVHRRMNQWSRQCGHDLSLIRWYPYQPTSASNPPSPLPSPPSKPQSAPLYPILPSTSSSTPQSAPVSPSPQPHKVPHVSRVERLIHLELQEKRVKRLCAGCGKEHREWFEIEASKREVRKVDEIVRRWVGWGERQEGGSG